MCATYMWCVCVCARAFIASLHFMQLRVGIPIAYTAQ
jgi:hypothetical protein